MPPWLLWIVRGNETRISCPERRASATMVVRKEIGGFFDKFL